MDSSKVNWDQVMSKAFHKENKPPKQQSAVFDRDQALGKDLHEENNPSAPPFAPTTHHFSAPSAFRVKDREKSRDAVEAEEQEFLRALRSTSAAVQPAKTQVQASHRWSFMPPEKWMLQVPRQLASGMEGLRATSQPKEADLSSMRVSTASSTRSTFVSMAASAVHPPARNSPKMSSSRSQGVLAASAIFSERDVPTTPISMRRQRTAFLPDGAHEGKREGSSDQGKQKKPTKGTSADKDNKPLTNKRTLQELRGMLSKYSEMLATGAVE